MAYDPSDLRLPGWLLRLFDALIRIRLPLARGWRLSLSRPGVMYALALVGVWAAAFYSGNNLLYLCGSMFLALALLALWRAFAMLRRLRLPGDWPVLECSRPLVLRQHVQACSPMPAVVDVALEAPGIAFRLLLRLLPHAGRLTGRLLPRQRGLLQARASLATEAPLGLFRLERTSGAGIELLIMPESVPWQANAGVGGHLHRPGEGDEWHDLRNYVAGDPLSRVHWRRSTADIAGLPLWMVKRFSQRQEDAIHGRLRVDLRLPPGLSQADFEALLGKAWYWMQQQEGGELVLGRRCFDLDDAAQRRAAMRALAAAEPEDAPPVAGEGLLLSLGGVA